MSARRHPRLRCLLSLALCCLPAWAHDSASAPAVGPGGGALFEANSGAYDEAVQFVARRPGQSAFVVADGFWLSLAAGRRGAALQTRFVAGAPASATTGLEPTPTRVHHLRGNDRDRWRLDVPTFARVRWPDVWTGVDVELYLAPDGSGFEYDLRLQPGADLSAAVLEWRGQDALWIDERGALVLETAAGRVSQEPPLVFQADGTPVAGRFELRGDGRVGFAVGAHDADQLLVIDPVLSFACHTPADRPRAVATGAGPRPDVFVAGETALTDLPTSPGAWQPDPAGAHDLWIARYDHSGNVLRWLTYLGGSLAESAAALDVAPDGSLVIGANTQSLDFPTTPGAYDSSNTQFGGAVACLDATGTTLLWSTYLATSTVNTTPLADLVVDADGAVHVTGALASYGDLVTSAGAVSPSALGNDVAFAARLAADGSALEMCSWVPAVTPATSSISYGLSVAVDDSGRTVVAGRTGTALATTANALHPGQLGASDVFVAVFRVDGTAVEYLSYLGGNNADGDGGLGVGVHGERVWVGYTSASTNVLTTADAWQPAATTWTETVLTCLDTSLSGAASLLFATYLGVAEAHDQAEDLVVDATGHAVFLGTSLGHPLTDTWLGPTGSVDMFVAVARPDFSRETLTRVGWSAAEFGGSYGADLDLDADGGVLITCQTHSTGVTVGTAVPGSETTDGLLARFSRERSWMDVGRGMAGSVGTPRLIGQGDPSPGAPVSLLLTTALPQAPVCLALGTLFGDTPCKGGLLVPDLTVVLPNLSSDALGELTLPFTWPLNALTGVRVYVQAWVVDLGGAVDYAASNGLAVTGL